MTFHELCKTEKPLILPGAFDALSARLIQRAGFKAYFTGGFPTIGARWGLPDIGLMQYGEISSAVTDIMEGRVQYIFDNIIWSLPQIRAGKLKGLAITTRQRSPLAPDIPTVAESGVPGFEGITWLGLAAPAKTPGPVVERLGAELKAVLADKDVIAKLAATGAEPPSAPGPEGMRALLAEDIARWKAILSDGKIKLQ